MSQPATIPNLSQASQADRLFGSVDVSSRCDLPSAPSAVLYFGGADAVLESVASGRLLNEIALHLQVPIIWFHDWVERNVDPLQMSRAALMGAESMLVKSQMVLSVDADSAHDAAQARALAATLQTMAERIDSQRWGTKRADGLAGQTVNVQLNLGGGQVTAETIDVSPAEAADSESAPTFAEALRSIGVHLPDRLIATPDLLCPEPEGGFQ